MSFGKQMARLRKLFFKKHQKPIQRPIIRIQYNLGQSTNLVRNTWEVLSHPSEQCTKTLFPFLKPEHIL
jgi:hypothetical protein